MAGFTPEIPTMPQQFQHQQFQGEPQHMQQMVAMMSMTAAGMMGNGLGHDASTGVQTMTGPPQLAALVPDAGTAPAAGVDPAGAAQAHAMAQQMYMMYLQQAQMAAAAPFTAAPLMHNYSVAPVPLVAAISVSVEGMKFQYQLTEDDLQKVFSRYGSVREIRVGDVGTLAQITYDDISCAQAAMNDLNGKVLNGLDGTLRINWASTTAQQPVQQVLSPYPVMPQFPAGWGYPGSSAWPAAPASIPGMPGDFVPSSPQAPGTPPPCAGNSSYITPDGKPAHVKGVRKYTCRFLVGIESEKDFQVVRRIIGSKGSNMKHIVKDSDAKLRLRGVGSGYFEGAGQKESNEPLQLCVSCTSLEGYQTAVAAVETLMEGVYREFRTFCRETGRPEPDLHAKPQLVSSGRERGGEGGAYDQVFSPEGIPRVALQMGDDDDGDGSTPLKADGGRKRGRRTRGKKTDVGRMEKGEPPCNAPDVEEIHLMIDQRNEARRQCNFAEADRLRVSLHNRGVALMDEPGGRGKATEVTSWRYWRD